MNDIDFLIQKILEDNPRAEVRPGSAQRDLLIVPHSKLLEPVEEERSTIARAQSIANYATMTDEEMDALAANFFIYRDGGVNARTQVKVGFSSPTSVELKAGDTFQNSDSTKEYSLESDYYISSSSMSSNLESDGLYYTALLDVVATSPGDEYSVDADELIEMPLGPVSLSRVTNPTASSYGWHKETNAELFARIPDSISTRQILNTPGTRSRLIEQFRHIQEIFLVGHGHSLMKRDETFEHSSTGGASILPVSNFYGKLRGDTNNRNKAYQLVSTKVEPDIADFGLEVSQLDYTKMYRVNDSSSSALSTNVLFEDDFTRSGEFVPATAYLTLDSDGTAVVEVDTPALFNIGDLVRLIDDDTAEVQRIILDISEKNITFTDVVDNNLETAQNARVERVLRDEDVGNEWFESDHTLNLGIEVDGPQATVDSGKLVLGKASYATDNTLHGVSDAALEDSIEEVIKTALMNAGYNPSDTADVKTEVENLTYIVNTETTGDTLLAAATINVTSTAGFDTSGFAYIDGTRFDYTGVTGTSFTGCSGGVPATTAPVDVEQGIIPSIKANQVISVSPVVQRYLEQQNGLRITATMSTTDTSAEGKFSYILTRKKNTNPASYYYGFGMAWRISKADTGTTTTTTAVTALDATDVNVASTAGFSSSGVAILDGTPFSYTGITATSFTGCVGVVATTNPVNVNPSLPNVYLVDNGDLPNNANAYLARATTLMKANTDYSVEILITPPTPGDLVDESSAVEIRVWETSGSRPVSPTLSYGAYVPSSARGGYEEDDMFGISVYDCNGDQWYYDDLKIESVQATYPHYLLRFDAAAFSDKFKVSVTGRAWGEVEEVQTYGMAVKVWDDSSSGWVDVGTYTGTSLGTIETVSGYDAADYSDVNGYVYVMVSGQNTWGTVQDAQLEVDYASIFDDGITGVHVGNKVDAYMRSVDQIQSGFVDINSIQDIEYVNVAQGFSLPVASIDAVFLLDIDGEPIGNPLVEGTDYSLTIVRPEMRFSASEHNALTFPSARVGSNVRVYYSYFQYISAIQDFIDSEAQRLTAAEVLAKAFIPAYVDFTVQAGGYGISDDQMEDAIVEFINGLGTTLEVSDVTTEIATQGATSIVLPLTISVEVHSNDGLKTSNSVTNSLTVEENVRYIARDINVVRI
jgi:hypothetical protein